MKDINLKACLILFATFVVLCIFYIAIKSMPTEVTIEKPVIKELFVYERMQKCLELKGKYSLFAYSKDQIIENCESKEPVNLLDL